MPTHNIPEPPKSNSALDSQTPRPGDAAVVVREDFKLNIVAAQQTADAVRKLIRERVGDDF